MRAFLLFILLYNGRYMKRPKNGSTTRQMAYAMRSLSPQEATSKREMALAVGYAQSVADKPGQKIESTEGYANAMALLASKSGNVALKVLHELQNRDLGKESVSTLLEAISTIGAAWERFTPQIVKDDEKIKRNSLRDIILEDVRVIDAETKDVGTQEKAQVSTLEDDPMDF